MRYIEGVSRHEYFLVCEDTGWVTNDSDSTYGPPPISSFIRSFLSRYHNLLVLLPTYDSYISSQIITLNLTFISGERDNKLLVHEMQKYYKF